jgi:hypothetical protein
MGSSKSRPKEPIPEKYRENRYFGRPTQYRSEFCAMLIDHMSGGLSWEAFAGHPSVNVDEDTLRAWRTKYPDFLGAYRIGLAKYRMFYEKVGVSGLLNVKGKPTLNTENYKFQMKNRFPKDWRDRHEVENTGVAPTVNIYQSVLERIRAKKQT